MASSSTEVAPTQIALEYLSAFARAAHETANALACSSLLAGQSSESDDYGDVGVWLGRGDYNQGHEKSVLAALSLDGLTGRDVKAVALPRAFEKGFKLSTLADKLNQKYMFTVDLGPRSGGAVFYFMLGQLREDEDAWLGLVGVGICADD